MKYKFRLSYKENHKFIPIQLEKVDFLKNNQKLKYFAKMIERKTFFCYNVNDQTVFSR